MFSFSSFKWVSELKYVSDKHQTWNSIVRGQKGNFYTIVRAFTFGFQGQTEKLLQDLGGEFNSISPLS